MNRTPTGAAHSGERAPLSASSFPISLAGLAAGLIAIWLMRGVPALDGASKAAIAALAVFVTILALEFTIGRKRSDAGLSAEALRPRSYRRIVRRLAALCVIYAVIAFSYFVFPEYHGAFYNPFWEAVQMASPYLVIGTPVYFFWMDTHQRDPNDAYLQLADLLFSATRPPVWGPVRELIAGWIVKAYFLPLMFVYFTGQVDSVTKLYATTDSVINGFTFMIAVCFTVDLMFSIVGYTSTLRIFDSHIRSVEPTAFGIVIAIMCYQPFFSIIGSGYLHYQGSIYWDNWLAGVPVIKNIWGGTIICLEIVYALSTVSFGLRFSNLTHRGIITSGPYRFTKHPAYIAKCTSFWMISVPFIEPLGFGTAVRDCAGLALICVVYVLRARTEEAHLMRDPAYREYAQWIAEHGVFAKVRKVFRRDANGTEAFTGAADNRRA